ncbi:hypothetical protein SKAU_G00418380 [Synaphobranchus kaupii]|uniref:Uncharacterized protein n=1 Tax=Synaphobranchus kaupii TaxID=118154 RepID=A0A9Q1IAW4_SYNKA|nr:hypothetical protein SKAU_G00418380 [Synaphobranchus kaupii]
MPGIICAVVIFSVAGLSLTKGNNSTDGMQNLTTANQTTTSHIGTSPANGTTDSGTSPANGTTDSGRWWESFLTMNHGIAFAAGLAVSAIVCCPCFCAIGSCSRRKRQKQRDEDKDISGTVLVPAVTVNQQLSGSTGFVKDEQTALQAGGEQGPGATGDVYYATIDVSQLKKRGAEEGPDRSADTDYAEICKEQNSGEGEGEGEEGAEDFRGV